MNKIPQPCTTKQDMPQHYQDVQMIDIKYTITVFFVYLVCIVSSLHPIAFLGKILKLP
jgi:hypothetical protein